MYVFFLIIFGYRLQGALEYGDLSSNTDVIETPVSKQGRKRSSSAAEYAKDNLLDSRVFYE
jgi:hypothetical protein